MAERKSSGEPKKPASEDEAKPDEKAEPKAEAKTESKAEAKTESKAGQKPAAKPIGNIEDRMEGVQGWMAELEKRQERTSRVGGIALLLAILASGGALALGIINKQDAATTEDVDELTSKVNALGASVEKQTETQLKGINERLGSLERQVASLNERQRKTEADIATLRQDVNAAAADAAAAAARPAPSSGGGADNQP